MNHKKLWAILSHLSLLFAPIIFPGIIYFIYRKHTDTFNRKHALEAFAFHIFIALLLFISTLLVVIIIGLIMWIIVPLWAIAIAIRGAIYANKSEAYSYPFTSQFISMNK